MIMTFFSIGNFSEIRSFESYVFPFIQVGFQLWEDYYAQKLE